MGCLKPGAHLVRQLLRQCGQGGAPQWVVDTKQTADSYGRPRVISVPGPPAAGAARPGQRAPLHPPDPQPPGPPAAPGTGGPAGEPAASRQSHTNFLLPVVSRTQGKLVRRRPHHGDKSLRWVHDAERHCGSHLERDEGALRSAGSLSVADKCDCAKAQQGGALQPRRACSRAACSARVASAMRCAPWLAADSWDWRVRARLSAPSRTRSCAAHPATSLSR